MNSALLQVRHIHKVNISGMILGVRRLCAAALACAGCALLLAPALALARPNDRRATRGYLRAAAAYTRSISAALGASVAAIETRGSAIGSECPSSLTYAPRDEAFEEIGEEAHKTLIDAGAEQTLTARRTFARAVSRLRWSDPRLAMLVREQAAEELAPATTALPNVCADIAAWKTNAYAALPQSAEHFLAHSGRSESASSALGLLLIALLGESRAVHIARLLMPFETRREQRTARHIDAEEAQVSARLRTVSRAVGVKLAAELGITAL